MTDQTQKSASQKRGPEFSDTVKESAQQIWLAGLGAFARAQEEGGRVFETLVNEGLSIQRKTQAVTEEKISVARSKMASMADDIQAKAGLRWDKLENIFEDRLAKALGKLGVPSAGEMDALTARIDELSKQVRLMSQKQAMSKIAAKSAAKPLPRKAARPAARHAPVRKPD
jgi:poly(hydroxyalkanoate) granule-associated protein